MTDSNLDNKLREVLDTYADERQENRETYDLTGKDRYDEQILPVALQDIKQAFEDEGYIQPDQEQLNNFVNQQQELMRLKLTPTPTHIYYKDELPTGVSLMTGQEWYDRFEKALKHEIYGDCDVDLDCAGCACDALEAAKKASGL